MDGAKFDQLTRCLATSRRGVLKHLVAALVAGAGGLVGAGATGAQGCAALRRRLLLARLLLHRAIGVRAMRAV